jgi:hypothetical protein
VNPTGRPAVLPGMFGEALPRQHKAARQTSREVYRRQLASDKQLEASGKETRCGKVLRLLAGHWNRYQRSPTAYELFHYAIARGELLQDVNSIRPRLTELLASGLVWPHHKRRCAVTGKIAMTWSVREAGSVEPR